MATHGSEALAGPQSQKPPTCRHHTYRRFSRRRHMSPRSRSRGLSFCPGCSARSGFTVVLHRGAPGSGRSGHNRLMQIEVVESVSGELVEAIASLLPQLSSASPPSRTELQAIVDSPSTSLLVARDGDSIVGTLTLTLFRIPTGVRAWIHDVVVHESARGHGIGEALTLRAVDVARAAE